MMSIPPEVWGEIVIVLVCVLVLTEKSVSYVVDYVAGDLFFLLEIQLIRLLSWRVSRAHVRAGCKCRCGQRFALFPDIWQ